MCAGQVWELPVLNLQNVTENTQKDMKNPETDTKRPTRDARRTQSNTNHQRTAARWHKTTIKWHKMTGRNTKLPQGNQIISEWCKRRQISVSCSCSDRHLWLCVFVFDTHDVLKLVHVRGGSRARRLFSPESDSLMFRLLLREIACVVTRGWVNIDQ